ncbi:MAG: PAS domain S-box protein [Desulfobacterales bacterium]|nr:PAS domain S-box protein [Desulfobacterales bacterium]
MELKVKFSRRLSYRQAKNTVIIALLLGLLSSVIQIALDFLHEREKTDSIVLEIISMFHDAAARAVYDIDELAAKSVSSGLFKYQPIRRVEIIDDFGNILNKSVRNITNQKQKWLEKLVRRVFDEDKKYTVSLYIRGQSKSFGNIIVGVDTYLVAENFLKRAILVLVSGIVRNIALSFVLMLMFYYSLTLPLLRATKEISKVDIAEPAASLVTIPKGHQDDEFGLLIDTVNMVLNSFDISLMDLEQTEQALRKSESKYRNIFENSISGIFQILPTGFFVTANPSLARICGYDSSSEFIMNINNIARHLFTEPEKYLQFQDILEKEGFIKDFEFNLKRKDQSIIIAVINAQVVKDEKDTLLYYEGILEDITQRKQGEELMLSLNRELEQRVLERTSELEAANKELEAFSYSVSHDLRAPLRAIDGFSQALLEDYYDKLDDDGRDFLQRIRVASQKMGKLIDDLLKLSRVTRDDMKREELNLSLMVKDILENLSSKEPQREVEILIEDNLTVSGDARLIRIMLDNLLGNAWKYTSKVEHTRIEFGKKIKNDIGNFYIKDNGDGFNMIYVDKLFKAFNRLHTPDKFEGTGIGLAIVQRVINRHGGSIWAEGKEGEGAVFYFIL